ncbi:MAG: winged helix-turn-helix transcriptional regulator [Chromatiales bacterium]|nr:MAG: winged helix-turn-helix transcriptional regulator [Chromatiales bacterium]
MSPTAHGEPDIVYLYATFWRMVSLAVHRYGSAPSGQLLVAITMVILDRYDYEPTVTELADITQLPKSSISRYVAAEMNSGMLEEFIDPNDRRRRRLRPTALAREEQKWHERNSLKIHEQMREIGLSGDSRQASGTELVKMLKNLNLDLLREGPADSSSDA